LEVGTYGAISFERSLEGGGCRVGKLAPGDGALVARQRRERGEVIATASWDWQRRGDLPKNEGRRSSEKVAGSHSRN
jgi:hypothetical protein